MKRAALYLLIAMLAACASFSRSSNDAAADADADALARAETSFAAMSSSSGVKAAFLDALGDDATLFRPGPVDGKTFMAARPDPAIVRWQVLIDHGISHSGSIGWGAPLEKIAIDRGPWSGERITAAEARF